MSKKKEPELDEFAQAQHAQFVAGLSRPESDADQARRQAGNLAEGGLTTSGELEVIKAADVEAGAADDKEQDR